MNRVAAITMSGGGAKAIEWRFRFGSTADVEAARSAVSKALADVELMVRGSVQDGDLDRLDAFGWRRLAESHDIRIEGETLVVTPR